LATLGAGKKPERTKDGPVGLSKPAGAGRWCIPAKRLFRKWTLAAPRTVAKPFRFTNRGWAVWGAAGGCCIPFI